jgi:tryptophanyl-tRNA synthetase
MSSKPVMLSGIKPTGEIHLGNYFGAMRQLVELSKSGEYQCFIMVADYHALNFIQNAAEMRELSLDLAAAYIALGLEPQGKGGEGVVLFKQSEVPAHTELAWIFDTITTMPYLMRAHAFKAAVDKMFFKNHPNYLKELDSVADNEPDTYDGMTSRVFSGLNVGTFNYPMLMAADILLYDTALVPVGQDQKQHIEYARDTAEKFNRIFADHGETFTLPKEHILEDVAIVPGIDGQKMSKSYGNTIPLFASRDVITEKVMGIVTDSSGERPENVYAIHKLIKTESELTPLYEEHKGKYKALKEALIEDLDIFIAPLRAKYIELKDSPEKITAALEQGAEQAREVSDQKMRQVKKAIGVL